MKIEPEFLGNQDTYDAWLFDYRMDREDLTFDVELDGWDLILNYLITDTVVPPELHKALIHTFGPETIEKLFRKWARGGELPHPVDV